MACFGEERDLNETKTRVKGVNNVGGVDSFPRLRAMRWTAARVINDRRSQYTGTVQFNP